MNFKEFKEEYQPIQDEIYMSNYWNSIYGSDKDRESNSIKEEVHTYQNNATNYTELYTYNREYKLVFSKRPRVFSNSDYSKYQCTIEFRNSIDIPICNINVTEKDFLTTAEELSLFISSYGSIYDSIIHFGDSNNTIWFMFLSYCNMQGEYPSDDDDLVSISLYSDSFNQGNKLRISFITPVDFLQDFIRSIYQILVDIPYVDNMIQDTIAELYNRWAY